jgi:hypothetical protein
MVEENMKFSERFSVIMIAVMFLLALGYAANVRIGGWMSQQLAVGHNQKVNVIPVASWSESGVPTSSFSNGAVRVNRDFGAYTKDDLNQFGDDRAYNSSAGLSNREADFKATHWIPETCGLMGDYWRDMK